MRRSKDALSAHVGIHQQSTLRALVSSPAVTTFETVVPGIVVVRSIVVVAGIEAKTSRSKVEDIASIVIPAVKRPNI